MFGWFKKATKQSYELVEMEVSPDTFRQGIRLLESGIVVTISPKVAINEHEDGTLHVAFDFNIEANPNNNTITYDELKSHIGDIIIDLIEKDYCR
jgi:hypothetical protein